MSILSTDLVMYGSAGLPLDDASAVGGAIDKTRRTTFAQLTQPTTLTYVSDGADVRTITAVGRDSSGTTKTETVTLTGATPVVGTQIFERIQKIILATTDGARTVTVSQTSGASSLGTIPPNEIGFYGMFLNSASGQAATIRYEKFFYANNNPTTTLNSAQVTLAADPSSKISIGLAPAVNDNADSPNRLTAPQGVVFAGVGVAQSVPGGGALPAGAAIGVWVKQSLLASDAPQKNAFTVQLSGTSV